MLRITNLRVGSFSREYLDLSWEVASTHEDAFDYGFYVLRATRDVGEYLQLNTEPIIAKYRVRDGTVPLIRDQTVRHYYKIKVVRLSTGESSLFPAVGPGVSSLAKMTLQGAEAARQEALRLRAGAGRLVFLCLKRRTGVRCSCYDIAMKQFVRSNCPTCFSTGYVGGFEAVVKTYAQLSTHRETLRKLDIAELKHNQALLLLPHYPEIHPGDIVIEAENTRWRVTATVDKFEYSRAIIRQSCVVNRIDESDIEHAIPVREDPLAILGTNGRLFSDPQSLEREDTPRQSLASIFSNLR